MTLQAFNNKNQDWLKALDQKALMAWVNLKSQPADLPENFLPRPRLLHQLDTGKRTTWLLAPAGFGKTTLLSHCYHTLNTESESVSKNISVWLSLGAKDNSALFLLRHLIAAIEQQMPGVVTDALAHCMTLAARSELDSEEVVLLLLADLADINRCLVLFIDNVHELNNPEAWQVISQLITLLPNNMQCRLASRYVPVGLGNLLLSAKLGFIQQQDLGFTQGEILTWLGQLGAESKPLSLSLMNHLHGWPAGLGLWLADQPSRVPVQTVYNPVIVRAKLNDYFQSQILNELPVSLHRFLCQVAPLGSFNAALCDAVLGNSLSHCHDAQAPDHHDSAQCLAELLRRNIFIEVMDKRQGWFVLHPLLLEYLRTQASAAHTQNLHQQGFDWLKQHGYRIEALTQAKLGCLGDEVSQWLEEEADRILSDLDVAGLLSWCEQAGTELIQHSLRLRLMHIWSLLLTYQYDGARALIINLPRADLELNYPGQLPALYGYLARGDGDYTQARLLCQQSLEQLGDDRFPVRVLMYSTLSNIELVRRDPEAARIWNRKALSTARQHQAPGLELLALFDHARIEQFRGQVSRSAELIDQGLMLAQEVAYQPRLFPRARLMLYRSFIRWLQGDLDAAELDAYHGIDEAIQCRDATVLYGHSILVLVHLGRAQFDAAFDVLSQAERLMQRWQVADEVYVAWLNTVKANVWIGRQQWARAEDSLALAKACAPSLDQDGVNHLCSELFPMLGDFYLATRTRLLSLQGHVKDAQPLLTRLLNQGQPGIMLLFGKMISAKQMLHQGQKLQAQRVLDEVEDFSQQQSIHVSLESYLKADSQAMLEPREAPVISPAMRASSDGHIIAPEQAADIGLSTREQEVLHLIASGCSNQNVADQLFISLHTVKTHARKINIKLGVKSRTQAIVRARELSILG